MTPLPSAASLRVVFVDVARMASTALRSPGAPILTTSVERLSDALRVLAADGADCVVIGVSMPHGLEAMRAIGEVAPDAPVVALVDPVDAAAGPRLVRAGAHEVVVRGNDGDGALARAIQLAVERRRSGEREEVERLVREVSAGMTSRMAADDPRRRRLLHPFLAAGAGAVILLALEVLTIHAASIAVAIAALFSVAAIVQRSRGSSERSERLLRAITDGTTDAITVRDLEGRYLMVNEAFARLVGLPVERIVGRTAEEIVDAETAADWDASHTAALAAGEPRRIRRVMTVDGAEQTLSFAKAPLRDAGGRITGVITTARDETQSLRYAADAERCLAMASDLLGTVGPRGHVDRVNPAWTRLLGWSEEELRSRALVDFAHPHDRDAMRRALAGDGPARVQLATSTGGWRELELSGRATGTRTVVAARDLTEAVATERTLAEATARHRLLARSLPGASVVTFDHDLRFTYAEGEALALIGIEHDQIGRTLAEVLPAHAAAALAPRYRAALGGHPQRFRHELAARGLVFDVQILPIRDGDGAVSGGMVLSQEVSALARAEAVAAAAGSAPPPLGAADSPAGVLVVELDASGSSQTLARADRLVRSVLASGGSLLDAADGRWALQTAPGSVTGLEQEAAALVEGIRAAGATASVGLAAPETGRETADELLAAAARSLATARATGGDAWAREVRRPTTA